MLTVCLDTESYYDEEVSVVPLGYWHYARHPKADMYLISLCDGQESWAGHPRDFNWDSLNGVRLLEHNKAHDDEMIRAGQEAGRIPKFTPAEVHCTANMASFLWNVRSLADACRIGLGVELSKGVRSRAKGKTVEDMVREGWYDDMVVYGRSDAVRPWQLWDKYAHLWPEHERRLSNLTIEQGRYGVAIDTERLTHYIEVLQRLIFTATNNLPWVARGRKPGSPIGIAEECRSSGIPPMPVKQDDEEAAEEWEETYAPRFPWVMALRNLRKGKKTLAFLQTMHRRLRPDNTVAFSLKYCGASTGRWAGDAGMSFHNLPKSPFFIRSDFSFELDKKKHAALDELFDAKKELPGISEIIDIRGLIVARPGMKLAPTDLSQIEPRCINYTAGNHAFLKRVAEGMSIYEVHARDTMFWTGGKLKDESKPEYARAKIRVLSFNYGCGWKKAIVAALKEKVDLTVGDEEYAKKAAVDGKIYRRAGRPGDYLYNDVPMVRDMKLVSRFEVDPTLDTGEDVIFVLKENRRGVQKIEVQTVYGQRARAEIASFRESNKPITDLWSKVQKLLEEAIGGDLEMELHSGRKLIFRDIRTSKRKVKDEETGEMVERNVLTVRVGNKRQVIYGSLGMQNFNQADAREVFAHNMLLCDDAGIRVLFHVHDEIVPEVPLDFDTSIITKLMSTTPPWLEGCPIAAETKEMPRYAK